MTPKEQKRFDDQYRRHLRALKLQGKADRTIDVYARAVRRLAAAFDCCPDRLTIEQLSSHFEALVHSHSWSTVTVDRNGLQFFWKHVLKQDWQWLKMVKPPKIKTLPDILTVSEVEAMIGAARQLRYRVFVLTTYSMGLRLGEALALQVRDIDAQHQRVHIRRGKGHKDRFVPLPDLTYQALRALWAKHRNPKLLFPSTVGTSERIVNTNVTMARAGIQRAVKCLVDEVGIKKRFRPTRFAILSRHTCLSTA